MISKTPQKEMKAGAVKLKSKTISNYRPNKSTAPAERRHTFFSSGEYKAEP